MRRDRTVLCVGEEIEVRTLLTAVFAAVGYEFTPLDADKLEAALAEAHSPVVLLGVGYATRNWIELLKSIRERHPGTPVIMLASAKDVLPPSIKVMRNSGAEALFFRPLMKTDELVACVAEAFRKLDRWEAVAARLEAS